MCDDRPVVRSRSAICLAAVAAIAGCGGDGESAGDGGAARSDPPAPVQIARNAGCLACHAIGADGNAQVGGELDGVGSRRTREEIDTLLDEPPAGMPSYEGRLSADERRELVDYLAALR